eukprot:1223267-Alexandrium_andersonii.AAC.1
MANGLRETVLGRVEPGTTGLPLDSDPGLAGVAPVAGDCLEWPWVRNTPESERDGAESSVRPRAPRCWS